MASKTKIEWTDATWNPVTGCTKVSPGCANCYAERLMPRLRQKFDEIRIHPERLDQPGHWRSPRKIFVNSMSDLFHDRVPTNFITAVFLIMQGCPQHTFQILTKRPESMQNFYFNWPGYLRTLKCSGWHPRSKWSERAKNWAATAIAADIRLPFPNVWLGVSVEDQETADRRIPILLRTPAAARFVSYEPALAPLDLKPQEWLGWPPKIVGHHNGAAIFENPKPALQWIIAGGESGPHARPSHPDWVRSVRDQCNAARVPFFFKQWGEWAHISFTSAGLRGDRTFTFPDGTSMAKIGKKRAGRLLDGREWNEMPKI